MSATWRWFRRFMRPRTQTGGNNASPPPPHPPQSADDHATSCNGGLALIAVGLFGATVNAVAHTYRWSISGLTDGAMENAVESPITSLGLRAGWSLTILVWACFLGVLLWRSFDSNFPPRWRLAAALLAIVFLDALVMAFLAEDVGLCLLLRWFGVGVMACLWGTIRTGNLDPRRDDAEERDMVP